MSNNNDSPNFSDVQMDFHPTHGGPPDPNPSLGNSFLSSIPEVDRNVVAKYINEWDKGVTKRFDDIHNEYRPYKELGDVDYLRKAVDFIKYIDQDPQGVYEYLGGILKEMGYEGENDDQGQNQEPTPITYEGLPQEFTDRFSMMEQALMQVVQQMQGQQQTAQEERESRQLDNLLAEMHTKYGDFDEQYVVSRFIAGDDPERAMQSYQALVEKISASTASKPTPPPSFFSGNGGGVPTGQVDPKDLSSADIKAYVASMLKAANEG